MKWFQVYDPMITSAKYAHELETYTAEDAAESYCHDMDAGSGAGPCDRRTVLVRERGSDQWREFDVESEAVINYSAYEADEPTLHAGQEVKPNG